MGPTPLTRSRTRTRPESPVSHSDTEPSREPLFHRRIRQSDSFHDLAQVSDARACVCVMIEPESSVPDAPQSDARVRRFHDPESPLSHDLANLPTDRSVTERSLGSDLNGSTTMTRIAGLIQAAIDKFATEHGVAMNYSDIARRSAGRLTRQRIQQLASGKPLKAMPIPETISGLASGLGLPYRTVLLAALRDSGYQTEGL